MESLQEKRWPGWGEPLILFLLFTLTLPMIYHFARIGFDPHHTGLMYKTALDVAKGKVLFAETFTQYGALVSWVQALFLLIFGERVTSILLCTALFYALSYPLLYLVSRRFLGRALSLAATLITVFLAPFYFWDFHPWSSVYALFFLLLATLCGLWAIEKSGSRGLIAAALCGLCAALTFWCRQPAGLVAVLAGLICFGLPALILRRDKETVRPLLWRLLLFCGGVAVGAVALLIPIMASGATADFLHQSISGMVSFAGSRSYSDSHGILFSIGLIFVNLFVSPITTVFDLPVLNAMWSLLPLAAVGFAVYAVVLLVKAAKGNDPARAKNALPYLFYGVFATCAWHQYYPVACFRHWYWGAFLCVPAALVALRTLVNRLSRFPKFAWLRPDKRRLYAFLLAAALLLLPNASVRLGRGIQKTASMGDMVRFEHADYHHLDGLYLSPETALYYGDLFNTVKQLQDRFPERNVVNLTENGIFAVFGENFHPMFNNAGDFYYADYPAARDAYIAAERPILIGWDGVPPSGYVLYRIPAGFSGDVWEDSHRMPAHIYLPVELYVQMR